MVYFMRPADAEQIAVLGFESFKPVVDKPVVKNEIDKAIYADAYPYPKARI